MPPAGQTKYRPVEIKFALSQSCPSLLRPFHRYPGMHVMNLYIWLPESKKASATPIGFTSTQFSSSAQSICLIYGLTDQLKYSSADTMANGPKMPVWAHLHLSCEELPLYCVGAVRWSSLYLLSHVPLKQQALGHLALAFLSHKTFYWEQPVMWFWGWRDIG